MSNLDLPAGYAVKKMQPLRPGYAGVCDRYPWAAWVKPGNFWVNVGFAKTEDDAIGLCIAHHAKVLEIAAGVVTL
jgi:hypothetical protein